MPAAREPAAVNLELLNDPELAALAERRDASAFRLIMERNNRRLFRLARSVLRDDAEAEDVVQETYVRAAAHLASFRGEARLSTWLARIALNEALMRLRRVRQTVEVEAIDAVRQQDAQIIMFPGVSVIIDPETAVAHAEIRRMIEQAVDELPEPFRLVFVMRDIEGMNVEETARYLGLRLETVRTRLFRARRLLRNTLDDALASALNDSFPFDGERCARLTEAVLVRLDLTPTAGT